MDLLERSGSPMRHPWELARFHVVRDLADRHLGQYQNKNILDLGCGDLYFLKRFAEDKPNTRFIAVDKGFDEEMMQRESGRINCYRSLEELPAQEKPVDLIFMMDLLEHVEDDLLFLKSLLRKPFVRADTLFIITVPAYEKLFGEHDRFLEHFRRYTNSSLEAVTAEAGLRTVEKGYFFFSLLLPRYLQVLREKINPGKDRKAGSDLSGWKRGRYVTNCLETMLLWDYHLHRLLKKAGIPTPGLSNYIVCKIPVL